MKSYNTKQKELLIEFFKGHRGVHINAGDVYEYLKEQGASIGQSTIYRRLESLVDEGVINKYIIDKNSSACFEYVGEDSSEDESVCFHCKCDICGKLIHMNCESLNNVRRHLLNEHEFSINPFRTVFYGRCKECIE